MWTQLYPFLSAWNFVFSILTEIMLENFKFVITLNYIQRTVCACIRACVCHFSMCSSLIHYITANHNFWSLVLWHSFSYSWVDDFINGSLHNTLSPQREAADAIPRHRVTEWKVAYSKMHINGWLHRWTTRIFHKTENHSGYREKKLLEFG